MLKNIAFALIDGPEAKGKAQFSETEKGNLELQLIDFWVAPGAPDVWIVLSQNEEGKVDNTLIELAPLPGGNFEQTFSLSRVQIDLIAEMKTLLVYCKKFSVHFGHGVLIKN